jgi:hypothetical protein
MLIRIALVLLCLHYGASGAVTAQRVAKPPRARTITLEKFGEYPNQYRKGTFKISNVVLEDLRRIENDNISVFQLYDPRTGTRQGEKPEKGTFNPYAFLICAGPDLSNRLFAEKDKWLNQKVNVYAQMEDVGLTVFVYTGYITRIELLDEKRKVVKTIQ